ncbi:unnamed protein product [Orchesella dallaii]|uniref:VWFA domain-containing protein n=1 Tax=Orchesella dallaii TaxID=48710 RepID=A0ABP1RM27_9HEXA
MASVKSLCSLIGLLIFIGLGNFVQAWPTDEDTCSIEEPVRLQVVFCFDQSATFRSFLQQFQSIAGRLTSALENQFPGSEFGVTAFADYPSSEVPDESGTNYLRVDTNTSLNSTACYLFHQSLTTDQNLFRQSTQVSGIIYTVTGGAENSLGAVMFTALDERIRWNNGERDANGVLVRKIIVFVTDEFYSGLLNSPNPTRRPARGDGTDTCTNSLPPTIPVITDVLQRKGVSVIGLYVPTTERTIQQLFTHYGGLFGQIGVPYSAYELDINNINTIPDNVLRGVRATTACIWADPPAYNTLGL